jgi:AraC-like DNA-binding protein
MDGNEMTRRLKNDEKTCHIPIILLTAKSGQDSKLEGLELGADAYITKPFSMKELQVRIKSLIDVRRRLQEKFSKGEYLAKPEENLSRLGRAKAETYSKLDEKYMSRLMEVINAHLSEEEFSIEEIGEEVGMSRAQIYRKLKALTGKSPSLFLRTIRLSKARQMIQNKEASISEIAYLVGFSSPAYFSRCFREEFGHTPSEIK